MANNTNLRRVVRCIDLAIGVVDDSVLLDDFGKNLTVTAWDDGAGAIVAVNQSFNRVIIINEDAIQPIYYSLYTDPTDHFDLSVANQEGMIQVPPICVVREKAFYKRLRLMLLSGSTARARVIMEVEPT